MESGYVRVADTSEIPIGKMKKVVVQGKEILVANVNGIYYAIGNVCTMNVETSRRVPWKETLSFAQNTNQNSTSYREKWFLPQKWGRFTQK
jgi:nitrite reductase/ring-hydroxylating ferredoxin subunit